MKKIKNRKKKNLANNVLLLLPHLVSRSQRERERFASSIKEEREREAKERMNNGIPTMAAHSPKKRHLVGEIRLSFSFSEGSYNNENEHQFMNQNKLSDENNALKDNISGGDSVDVVELGPAELKNHHKFAYGKNKPFKKGGSSLAQQVRYPGNLDRLSKFMILCLTAIQNALMHDGIFNIDTDKHLLVSNWGVEFWECFCSGSDILEMGEDCSSIEQISWIISTAADIISWNEYHDVLDAGPFLLYLVPSQEKAIKVRSICKALKALGIHTVSLHAGASLEHQIQGLKTCEPEFVVATPERILELVSLRAIDISGLSILVIDGLEILVRDGFLDSLKTIKQSISGDSQTVIFNGSSGIISSSVVQDLLNEPICRLSLASSIASQSAWISQRIHTCSSEEKLSKGIEILNQECGERLCPQQLKVLFVAETNKVQLVANALMTEGYSILNYTISDNFQTVDSEKKALVSIMDTTSIKNRVDISEFEVVVILDFPLLIQDYVRVLTRMARHSVNGVLHSCFCQGDVPLAAPLIKILHQCGQDVPVRLRNYLYVAFNLEDSSSL